MKRMTTAQSQCRPLSYFIINKSSRTGRATHQRAEFIPRLVCVPVAQSCLCCVLRIIVYLFVHFSFCHWIICPSIYIFWLSPYGIFKLLFRIWISSVTNLLYVMNINMANDWFVICKLNGKPEQFGYWEFSN